MVSEQMKADGWIEHDGSGCPAPGRGTIEVMLRNGRISMNRFGFWTWKRSAPMDIDIVAWRPDRPAPERLAA
jgi:hypothetical protein